MKKSTESISLKSIQYAVSTADRGGVLDAAIKKLPAVNMSAMRTSAYYRIARANQLLEEASKMRTEAIAEFVRENLNEDDNNDGWTRAQLLEVFENPV